MIDPEYDRGCFSCFGTMVVEEDMPENCDACPYPEVSKDGRFYRDTCDVCHCFIMIPFNARDHNNIIVCKICAIKPYDMNDDVLDAPIGTYEGVFIEGENEWWK